jgi:chaperonin GroEL (HSP60 family)
MNPILIKRGMDEALKMVLEKLETFTKKIDSREERLNIATISANNDNEL